MTYQFDARVAMVAQKWGAGTHQCGAETTMLRRSGALESTIAALEPQLCTRVGVWRPAKRRWNRNAAQEWGAGTHNCSAGAAMLHRRGALEPTSAALELQCCTPRISGRMNLARLQMSETQDSGRFRLASFPNESFALGQTIPTACQQGDQQDDGKM